MNLENYFISQFNNKLIGDDAAVVGDFVYSKDAFFEDVHFKKEWISYYNIARKAMFINISDAIAMNAVPKYVLLSVAMPRNISKNEMKELADGFLSVAKEYNIEVIGGDTISNIKLDITITVISKTKKPLKRKGLKSGCFIAYTGVLGNSSKELKKLFNLGKIHNKSKFIDIKLRRLFVEKSSKLLKTGMDISDGLYSDLYKMLKINNIGVRVFKNIPKRVFCSGEEYEMLVSFDKRDKKAILRKAKQTRTEITIFAETSRNKFRTRCKSHHF